MMSKIKKINWVNVVLFFSLALNFFIAGYLASDKQQIRRLFTDRMAAHHPEIRMVDYFPKEKKDEFRHYLHDNQDRIRPIERNLIETQKEILAIISPKEVDEKQLRDVFEKYQNANDQLQVTINEIVIKMILDMDYDTRSLMIKRGKRAHEKREMRKEKLSRAYHKDEIDP